MLPRRLLALVALAQSQIVSERQAFVDLKACAKLFHGRAPVIVTSADNAFARVVPLWSRRLASFGLHQQVLIALSGGVAPEGGRTGVCVARYGFDSIAATELSRTLRGIRLESFFFET